MNHKQKSAEKGRSWIWSVSEYVSYFSTKPKLTPPSILSFKCTRLRCSRPCRYVTVDEGYDIPVDAIGQQDQGFFCMLPIDPTRTHMECTRIPKWPLSSKILYIVFIMSQQYSIFIDWHASIHDWKMFSKLGPVDHKQIVHKKDRKHMVTFLVLFSF